MRGLLAWLDESRFSSAGRWRRVTGRGGEVGVSFVVVGDGWGEDGVAMSMPESRLLVSDGRLSVVGVEVVGVEVEVVAIGDGVVSAREYTGTSSFWIVVDMVSGDCLGVMVGVSGHEKGSSLTGEDASTTAGASAASVGSSGGDSAASAISIDDRTESSVGSLSNPASSSNRKTPESRSPTFKSTLLGVVGIMALNSFATAASLGSSGFVSSRLLFQKVKDGMVNREMPCRNQREQLYHPGRRRRRREKDKS